MSEPDMPRPPTEGDIVELDSHTSDQVLEFDPSDRNHELEDIHQNDLQQEELPDIATLFAEFEGTHVQLHAATKDLFSKYAVKHPYYPYTNDYVKVYCPTKGCTFETRWSKRKDGLFHLIKCTLHHSQNCPNLPSLNKEPSVVDYVHAISRFFQSKQVPTREIIRAALQTQFGELDLSDQYIDRIRHIGMLIYVGQSCRDIPSLLEHARKTLDESWTIQERRVQGELHSILITPKFATHFTRVFSSPLIVDATHTSNQIQLHILSGVDAQFHTQILGISAAMGENATSYYDLLMSTSVSSEEKIAIISDEGRAILSAVNAWIQRKNLHVFHMFCLFHVMQTFERANLTDPKHKDAISISLHALMQRIITWDDFLQVLRGENLSAEKQQPIIEFFETRREHLIDESDNPAFTRGICSSQRAESVHSVIKRGRCSHAEVLLNQVVDLAQKWAEKSRTQPRDCNTFIYFKQININKKYIKPLPKSSVVHDINDEGQCSCKIKSVTGFPCFSVFLRLMEKQPIDWPSNVDYRWTCDAQEEAMQIENRVEYEGEPAAANLDEGPVDPEEIERRRLLRERATQLGILGAIPISEEFVEALRELTQQWVSSQPAGVRARLMRESKFVKRAKSIREEILDDLSKKDNVTPDEALEFLAKGVRNSSQLREYTEVIWKSKLGEGEGNIRFTKTWHNLFKMLNMDAKRDSLEILFKQWENYKDIFMETIQNIEIKIN